MLKSWSESSFTWERKKSGVNPPPHSHTAPPQTFNIRRFRFTKLELKAFNILRSFDFEVCLSEKIQIEAFFHAGTWLQHVKISRVEVFLSKNFEFKVFLTSWGHVPRYENIQFWILKIRKHLHTEIETKRRYKMPKIKINRNVTKRLEKNTRTEKLCKINK